MAALVGARTVPFWKVVAAYGDRPVPYDTTVASALAAAITELSGMVVRLPLFEGEPVRVDLQYVEQPAHPG